MTLAHLRIRCLSLYQRPKALAVFRREGGVEKKEEAGGYMRGDGHRAKKIKIQQIINKEEEGGLGLSTKDLWEEVK